MATEFPDEIQHLRSFLLRDVGMTTVNTTRSDAFGNTCTTMANKAIQVRLTRDRGQWIIEVAPVAKTPCWHDILILRELLTGTISDDPLPLVEEVRMLIDNWAAIEETFAS